MKVEGKGGRAGKRGGAGKGEGVLKRGGDPRASVPGQQNNERRMQHRKKETGKQLGHAPQSLRQVGEGGGIGVDYYRQGGMVDEDDVGDDEGQRVVTRQEDLFLRAVQADVVFGVPRVVKDEVLGLRQEQNLQIRNRVRDRGNELDAAKGAQG